MDSRYELNACIGGHLVEQGRASRVPYELARASVLSMLHGAGL
jgi:hypothetical protein